MRHSKSGRKLNRTPAHRKALFRNMTRALLEYGKIRTTEAKAMELRHIVEPLITMAKKNDLHARREAYKFLNSHQMVKKLFDEIAPLFAGVPGGYTRVIKLGMPRQGDAAPLAVIEFTKEIAVKVESSANKADAKVKDKLPKVSAKVVATKAAEAIKETAAAEAKAEKKPAAKKPAAPKKEAASAAKKPAAEGEEKPKRAARKPKAEAEEKAE